MLLLSILITTVVALDQSEAQRSADALVFLLQAPGNCLISATDLPADAPSKNLAALWIRAAFHDVGTWDPAAPENKGGANGNLIYTLDQPDNAGLDNTLANQRINGREKYNISNADLIALGGAVTVTHCGGPKIPFRGGRVDVDISTTPVETLRSNMARLPGSMDPYATVKAKMLRMGFSYADIAALVTGSHTMGGVHKAISPNLTDQEFAPFDDTPGVFDNNVFKKSLEGNCALQVDCEIARDPDTRPFVELFASNQEAFFKQYAESFPKMTDLTTSNLDSAIDIRVAIHANLFSEGTKSAAGNTPTSSASLVNAFNILTLGYLFWIAF